MSFLDGQRVIYTGTFRDANGVLTDPTTATLITQNNAGEAQHTGGDLQHPSTGVYTFTEVLALTDPTQDELFDWRWDGTGLVAAPAQGTFAVARRNT